MTLKQLEQQITDIVAEHAAIDQDDIMPDSTTLTEMGLDSLDVVEVIMKVEDKLNITIPDEHSWDIRTIKDFVRVTSGIMNIYN